MIRFKLPITVTVGIKKKRNIALSLNWYRNANFHVSNNVKKLIKDIIKSQMKGCKPINGKYTVVINVCFKGKRRRDLSNYVSVAEKFSLDALVELGYLKEDDQFHHVSTYSSVTKLAEDNYTLFEITECLGD